MADEVYARVGAAIRSRRDGAGMTQSVLADRTGLKRTSITNIESGGQAITLHQLLEVARALGTDAGRLLADAEKMDGSAVRSSPNHPQATELLERLGGMPRTARR